MGKPINAGETPAHLFYEDGTITEANRIRRLTQYTPVPECAARVKIYPSQAEALEIPEDTTDTVPRFFLKSSALVMARRTPKVD